MQVLGAAHPAHVAVQTAEGERVAGAGDDVAGALEAVEGVLRLRRHEGGVGVGGDLGHAAEGLAGGAPEHRVRGAEGAWKRKKSGDENGGQILNDIEKVLLVYCILNKFWQRHWLKLAKIIKLKKS